MPPRSKQRVHERKLPFAKLSLLAISFLALSFYAHMMSWSSSLFSQNKEDEDTLVHRLNVVQDAPTPRNGGMVRHEHRKITDYDRQQDIHWYPVAADKPRVFFMSPSPPLTRKTRKVKAISTFAPSNDTTASFIMDFERPYYEECTPMQSWQKTFHPTCNLLHERKADTLLSIRGSWRSVWLTENDSVVLKMLHFARDFDAESFYRNQLDAMAMERLTRSKYVIDSYGFCGQSVLVEFAPHNGRELIKNKRISPSGRLLLARDLARGITDIHSMDAPKSRNATFVHNDVNIANIVAMNSGRIKFNDFNIGYPLKWNKTKPCGYPQRWQNMLWRSPEEIRNTTYVSEKVDVYSLGNILFQVMTTHQPWTHLEPKGKLTKEEVAELKIKGETPFIPRKYINSTDFATRTLYQAIQACFKNDPNDRPTAYQLSYGLGKALQWMMDSNTTMPITEELFNH